MIVGMGIDIIEVERLARNLADKDGLAEEIFSAKEMAYCRKKRYPAQHFAARFCAKEALFKALGSGKRGKLSWRDVETINDAKGSPVVRLRGATKERAKELGVTQICVSLSHTRQTAAACVILQSAKN
ncbi:MAG TPA: holo-ACP synthase [bacterium]|jgi:holo-[acyl-carrier protein] synthase